MKAPLPSLAAILALAAAAALGAEPGPRLVPAGDSRFEYRGRLDTRDPSGPVLIWEDSAVAVDFGGNHLELDLGPAEGDNFLDVRVDDGTWVAQVPASRASRFTCPLPLAAGRHHLEIHKRNEASAGTLQFRGIWIGDKEAAFRPVGARPALRLEFYGDSITAGACDEDGTEDQWETRRTHNAELGYASVVGRTFRADWRNQSVSGIGIVTGWTNVVAKQTWDRLYPKADSPAADLGLWTPDVVLVNLGDNDADYPKAHKLPFPDGFGARYTDYILGIRRAYPRAEIVMLLGGMDSGVHSAPLNAEWSGAVARLEAADPRMHHLLFNHWTYTHPRVPDHAALAAELTAWLKVQPFMKPFTDDAR